MAKVQSTTSNQERLISTCSIHCPMSSSAKVLSGRLRQRRNIHSSSQQCRLLIITSTWSAVCRLLWIRETSFYCPTAARLTRSSESRKKLVWKRRDAAFHLRWFVIDGYLQLEASLEETSHAHSLQRSTLLQTVGLIVRAWQRPDTTVPQLCFHKDISM